MIPNRVAFYIGSMPIYWYGVLIACGALLAAILAMVRERPLDLPKDTTIGLLLPAVPAALICARLFYVIFSLDYYAQHPAEVFNFRHGGIAIYGAIIGGVAAGYFYSKHKRISFGTLADLTAPSLALGQAIGRWGNFVNQEAYGAVVTNPAFQHFPISVYIEATGQYHMATFFYESTWCFIVCAILLVLERKKAFRNPGDGFLWYALLYAVERSVVEGLRTDSLYLFDVRISQLLSLLICLAVLGVFAKRALQHLETTSKRSIVLPCAVGVLACVAAVLAYSRYSQFGFAATLFVEIAAILLLLAMSMLVYRKVPHAQSTQKEM